MPFPTVTRFKAPRVSVNRYVTVLSPLYFPGQLSGRCGQPSLAAGHKARCVCVCVCTSRWICKCRSLECEPVWWSVSGSDPCRAALILLLLEWQRYEREAKRADGQGAFSYYFHSSKTPGWNTHRLASMCLHIHGHIILIRLHSGYMYAINSYMNLTCVWGSGTVTVPEVYVWNRNHDILPLWEAISTTVINAAQCSEVWYIVWEYVRWPGKVITPYISVDHAPSLTLIVSFSDRAPSHHPFEILKNPSWVVIKQLPFLIWVRKRDH